MKYSTSIGLRPALAAGFVLLSFAFILAACAPYPASAQGSSGNTPPAGTALSPTPLSAAAGSGDVQLANNPKFGQILVASNGFTLYTFDFDLPELSRCTDSSCIKYWPPYLSSGQPKAAAGITGTLGLISRADGTLQVTYNDMPLYTFAVDKNPGDAAGDGINQFGGVWHAIVVR